MTKAWGFSALVEFAGKRILFDTSGNAEILEHNVKALGVDLSKLDFVVISHRHGDHISGLNYLFHVNPTVKIYTPAEPWGPFG
jgi:7,8-dihydropterin-6-yl-methyl-4-(beta-D-ribofuranosyl)aminobenzene 5'-phosphate synthase